jgi:putative nucleotidyltransferase with HDIG domain
VAEQPKVAPKLAPKAGAPKESPDKKKPFEIDFKKFFSEILIPITPPQIVSDCIKIILPGDAQASAFEEIIEREAEAVKIAEQEQKLLEESNPNLPKQKRRQTFKSLFIMMVNSMGLTNEVTNITHAIGLLGVVQVRNAIMGMSLYQHFHPNENLKFDKIAGGDIENCIRYSLESERFCSINKCHTEVAFIPGLVFDLLSQVAMSKEAEFSKLEGVLSRPDRVIADIFQHSLAVAFIADYLVRRSKAKIHLGKYAYVAGLLHDIGKLALIIYSPKAYASLLQKRKETLKPFSQLEEALFDFPHETISALILRKLNLFLSAEIPIDHHHDHDILAVRNPDMHRLAALIEISDAIAHRELGFLGDTVKLDVEAMQARIIIKLEKHYVPEVGKLLKKLEY